MNYNNAVILEFKNAGIFKKYWKNSNSVLTSVSKDDRVLTSTSRNIRTKDQWVDFDTNTIHVNFIQNCMSVLFGKRPISKFRNTCAQKDNSIVNISSRCLVKIDSFLMKDKNGNDIYVYEKMATRKCLDDSWNQVSPSWLRIKYLVPEKLYKNLVSVASVVLDVSDPESVLFDQVADKLSKSSNQLVEDIVLKARLNKCEPLAKLLTGSKIHSLQQAGFNGLGPYLKTLVTKGVSDVARIDGKICIPVFESELSLFRNGNGCATIFDGGVVNIKQVVNLDYTTIDMVCNGYVPVAV